jgi:hypothetical protein
MSETVIRQQNLTRIIGLMHDAIEPKHVNGVFISAPITDDVFANQISAVAHRLAHHNAPYEEFYSGMLTKNELEILYIFS